MGGEWNSIPGFLKYEASFLGEVRSAGRWGKPIILRPRLASNGYLRLSLQADAGTTETLSVHRAVALSFLPNPLCLPQVNHIDGVKANNRASNLEWASPAANMAHAKASGLVPKGERASLTKLTEADVREIVRMTFDGVSSRVLAARFGVSQGAIMDIRKGRAWSWLTSTF